jgi:hypothetical protein
MIVVAGYGYGEDPPRGQPAYSRLEGAGRLVEAIVLVYDISTQRDEVDLLGQSVIDQTLPT